MPLLRQYQVLGVALVLAVAYTLVVHPWLTSLVLDWQFLHAARMQAIQQATQRSTPVPEPPSR